MKKAKGPEPEPVARRIGRSACQGQDQEVEEPSPSRC